MQKQQSFWSEPPKTHGGEAKRAKGPRPIATKRPMHLVMRAEYARGENSMLLPKHKKAIEAKLLRFAKRYHVRVYQFANVGTHLHGLVQARDRLGFQNFLRSFAGAVAQIVTGAKKGAVKGRFWDHLAFTRIVAWGKDWRNALRYLRVNQWEGQGYYRHEAEWMAEEEELNRRKKPG